MISHTNRAAVEGAAGYGITVHPAKFDPKDDAYKTAKDGGTYFHATTNGLSTDSMSMTLRTMPSQGNVPYPLEFIRSVTNQPTFANTSICDNYVRLYNTSLTTGPYDPVPVRGSVLAKVEPFAQKTQEWNEVYGWRFATAFLEPPLPQSCESLKGFNYKSV